MVGMELVVLLDVVYRADIEFEIQSSYNSYSSST
jgi:hypothetical protein